MKFKQLQLKLDLMKTLKKRYIAGAGILTAVALASCSSEEVSSPEKYDPSQISFNVVASRGTRSDVTTTSNIKEFCVTAYTEGKLLMDNVLVTRDGTSWTYSPAAYWPDQPVNFYAVSPDISDSPVIDSESTGTANINGYTNPGNIDLLYAVNIGEIQSGAPVNINFRHALAKVNVLLSSANTTINVKIKNVTIGNVYTKGSFSYPIKTTAAGSDVAGNWHNLSAMSDLAVFAATGTQGNVALTAEPVDLGESNASGSLDFILPQELGKLTYDASNKAFTGTYIAVDCEIYDKTTGGKLFPNTQTPSYLLAGDTGCGRILYPVTNSTVTEWKAGYSYVYKIAIDNPSVLFDGIQFGVTVDEMQSDSAIEYPSIK